MDEVDDDVAVAKNEGDLASCGDDVFPTLCKLQ